jgi:hypothetical protein
LIRIVVLSDLKHLVKFTILVTVEVETFEAVIVVEFEKATHRAGPGPLLSHSLFLALRSTRPLFLAHLVAPSPPRNPGNLAPLTDTR